MPPGTAPSRIGTASRLAFAQFALLAVIGVYIPWWPVWLQDRGYDPTEISWLIALPSLTRTIVTPLLAHRVDRTTHKRTVVVATMLLAIAVFPFLPQVDGFAALLALQVLFYSAFCALLPILDFFTLATARAVNVPYGRVRLFGSIGYLLASALTGEMLDAFPPSSIYVAMLAVLGAGLVSLLALPRPPELPREAPPGAPPLRAADWKPLLWLALACGLIQASHATYYVFATIHWKGLGIAEGTIGLLLATAVIAEIVLFMWGGEALNVFGAGRLLTLGGAFATVRWLVHPSLESPLALAPLQCLHAFSFGATHLATLQLLGKMSPSHRQATAQSLVFCVAAVIGAIAMRGSGPLFEAYGAGAYYAMAGLGIAGMTISILTGSRRAG